MAEPASRVSVFVADDHPLYREGVVVRALEARDEFELAGEAADGAEALERILEAPPDVAVLDLRLPGRDGIEIIEALAGSGTPTRAILLSAVSDSAIVYRALEAGAQGYLSKDADREAICDAVGAVAAGETVLAPQVQQGLAEQIRLQGREERPVLSPRELEILQLTAEGSSAGDIAERLFVSRATVKTHLQHVYEKLGVADRAAAVADGMRRGLVR
jgi:two-component system nitrate/nitrite response regulator NarL